jgi:hypothetical protein
MVKDGCRVAIRMEPLRYPMANVLQSEAGANAVMGSKMVLADRCSEVEGSNRMMLPCAFPKATFPFLIHVATLICSYDANLATSSPVNRSQTIAVEPAS